MKNPILSSLVLLGATSASALQSPVATTSSTRTTSPSSLQQVQPAAAAMATTTTTIGTIIDIPPPSALANAQDVFSPLPLATLPSLAIPSLETTTITNSRSNSSGRTTAASNTIWNELFGEALGTFWVLFIGSCASMYATFCDPFMTLPEVGSVWVLAVISSIYLTCPFSEGGGGAHMNPAMTLTQALFRGFDKTKVLPYWAAQLVGCTAGSAASYEFFADTIQDFEACEGLQRAYSIPSARVFGEYFDPSLSIAQAFGVEAFGTATITAVVFALTHPSHSLDKKIPVPLAVGATAMSLILELAPLTQAGLNPARDFGPRLVAYAAGWTDVAFQDCWVYILAPLVGAALGGALIDKGLSSFAAGRSAGDHTKQI